MESLPGELVRERHLDLHGRRSAPWVRRLVLLVLTCIAGAGALNVFGQGESSSSTSAPAGSLAVAAPTRVRGGLFYQGRLEVRARRRIASPRLVLGHGWAEQMQINTIEPAADSESSRHGRLSLSYGALPAGQTLTVWLQLEVNPTGAGNRDQSVALYDGPTPITRLRRDVTVFP